MKNKMRLLPAITLGLALTLSLTACSKPQENPEEVLKKFTMAMSQVDSAVIGGDLDIKGSDEKNQIDGKLTFTSRFDYQDIKTPKGALELGLKGTLTTEKEKISGDIALDILTISDNFYAKVSKLETDHKSIQSLKPLLDGYTGKWLHLAADLVPQNIRDMQQKQQEHRDATKKLIADSSFFKINKEYGVETINGQKTYHYGVMLDTEGVKEYMRRLSIISGRELTMAEIDDAVKVLSGVTNAEVWIGAKDYYLYQAQATINGQQLEQKMNMNFKIRMTASQYNEPLNLEAPEDSEEFNPLALLMGLSASRGLTAPAADETTEGTDLDSLIEKDTPADTN